MSNSNRIADLKWARSLLRAYIDQDDTGGPYLHHRIKTLMEINRELDALGTSEGAPIDEVAAARQARRLAITQDSPETELG